MAEFAGAPAFEADPPERDLRTTFEAYDVADTRLAMIADEDNEHAWIQSDTYEAVEQ